MANFEEHNLLVAAGGPFAQAGAQPAAAAANQRRHSRTGAYQLAHWACALACSQFLACAELLSKRWAWSAEAGHGAGAKPG